MGAGVEGAGVDAGDAAATLEASWGAPAFGLAGSCAKAELTVSAASTQREAGILAMRVSILVRGCYPRDSTTQAIHDWRCLFCKIHRKSEISALSFRDFEKTAPHSQICALSNALTGTHC
jgi:hypothetical protein